jgi:hypothetical protein
MLLLGYPFPPLIIFGSCLLADGLVHETTMQPRPAHWEEGFIGRLLFMKSVAWSFLYSSPTPLQYNTGRRELLDHYPVSWWRLSKFRLYVGSIRRWRAIWSADTSVATKGRINGSSYLSLSPIFCVSNNGARLDSYRAYGEYSYQSAYKCERAIVCHRPGKPHLGSIELIRN